MAKINITESQIKKIIAETTKKVLNEANNASEKLKALNVLGIVPVDVEGGRMWLNQETGKYTWSASEALEGLNLSELDDLYTYNYGVE